jgi:hypothetical protein
VVADVPDDAASPDDEDGTAPAPDQEAKPKNTVVDQLNKAVEVLKSRNG